MNSLFFALSLLRLYFLRFASLNHRSTEISKSHNQQFHHLAGPSQPCHCVSLYSIVNAHSQLSTIAQVCVNLSAFLFLLASVVFPFGVFVSRTTFRFEIVGGDSEAIGKNCRINGMNGQLIITSEARLSVSAEKMAAYTLVQREETTATTTTLLYVSEVIYEMNEL
jgi:hypothetical protein